jgi:hypothetical protein
MDLTVATYKANPQLYRPKTVSDRPHPPHNLPYVLMTLPLILTESLPSSSLSRARHAVEQSLKQPWALAHSVSALAVSSIDRYHPWLLVDWPLSNHVTFHPCGEGRDKCTV